MSIGHILLAAALFAIPVLLKYFLAFEMRTLVESLRSREEEVRRLSAQWRSLERERLVMRRAINQVRTQKRHATHRRERLERQHRQVGGGYGAMAAEPEQEAESYSVAAKAADVSSADATFAARPPDAAFVPATDQLSDRSETAVRSATRGRRARTKGLDGAAGLDEAAPAMAAS